VSQELFWVPSMFGFKSSSLANAFGVGTVISPFSRWGDPVNFPVRSLTREVTGPAFEARAVCPHPRLALNHRARAVRLEQFCPKVHVTVSGSDLGCHSLGVGGFQHLVSRVQEWTSAHRSASPSKARLSHPRC
jgi:hypothetical protein